MHECRPRLSMTFHPPGIGVARICVIDIKVRAFVSVSRTEVGHMITVRPS